MDAVDRELISLMRKDARTSVAILARKLGVSRGTVSNRITKLEDAGIIVGYTVRLRPDAQPNEIRAWMGVAVEGNETRSVIASLLGEPAVATLHDTNGRWDLLAELRAAVASTAPCAFAIDAMPTEPALLRIRLDGHVLRRDADYSWMPGMGIQLSAARCESVRDGAAHRLAAELLCEPDFG